MRGIGEAGCINRLTSGSSNGEETGESLLIRTHMKFSEIVACVPLSSRSCIQFLQHRFVAL